MPDRPHGIGLIPPAHAVLGPELLPGVDGVERERPVRHQRPRPEGTTTAEQCARSDPSREPQDFPTAPQRNCANSLSRHAELGVLRALVLRC